MTREPISTLPRRRLSMACMQFVLTLSLLFGLLVAVTAISMGIANAEDIGAIVRPDTGLMIGMLVVAVALMCALSAAAVRLVSRSRDR